MKEHTIYKIIAKKFAGESSREDEGIISTWLDENIENREIYHDLQRAWDNEARVNQMPKVINQDYQREKVWNESFEKNHRKPMIRKIPLFLLKVAASIAILLVAGWVGYKLVEQDQQPVQQPQAIVKENPNGQKSKIFLPDGSTVWLNAASKLSFMPGFSDSLRLISLDGEAFFDVVKDVNRPFVVETKGVRVTALGTSFNIDTHHGDLFGVSLVEGKVRVSAKGSGVVVILNPGEYSTFGPTEKLYKKGRYDPELTLSWKDGILCFKNAGLPEIIQELEQWYGVEIINDLSRKVNKHFNGRFDNENLENVLRNLSFALEFDYEMNGNKVVFENAKK